MITPRTKKFLLSLISALALLMVSASPVLGTEASEIATRQAGPKGQGTGAVTRLTWNDLVRLVDEHPLMAASRHTRAAFIAAVDAAGAAPNPTLDATAAYGRARGVSDSRVEWGLALSIPLDWVARRGIKMDAARSEVALAEAKAEVLRREVVSQLGALFWELVEAQERVSVLSETSRQAEVLLETVKRRVEMGEARPVEATRIAVESNKIGGGLETARITLRGRRARLASWLAGGGSVTVVAVAELKTLPEPMRLADAVDAVKRNHPMLNAETARLRSLAANLEVERRERMPSMSARVFTDHELDRRAYGGGLSIEMPLWNWNQGAVRRSESLLEAGKERARATRLDLEGETIEAQTKCRAGVTLAAHFRDQILPNAESAAKMIERTYELGEATLLELIDARRTLVETRGTFLNALVRAQTDCSRLQVLVGKEQK
jgi:cobalt-zinc-cadmium efflux system outer membrane protein